MRVSKKKVKDIYKITVGPRELKMLTETAKWRAEQPDEAVRYPSRTPKWEEIYQTLLVHTQWL